MMHSLLMYLALAATSSAWANAGANIQLPPAAKNTVYKCEVQGRTHYSDTPCPGAVEVDVTPTRGVHSMSGTKRTSAAVQHEAMLENMQRARQQAMASVLPASASAQPAVAQPAHAVQTQALASAPQPARTSSSALDPMQIIHGMLSTLLQAVQPLLWFLPLLVLVLIVKTAAFKGWMGELLIRQLLKKRPTAKAKKELHLHNVTLKDDRGTTQIDHVLISAYGVFVIETKNYNGQITGSAEAREWQQRFFQKQYAFQNPLRQNYRHIKALENTLKLPSSVFQSVVVFAGQCELKSSFPPNVCTKDNLPAFIQSFKQVVLTPGQIQAAYQTLQKNRLPDNFLTHFRHVRNLRKQHPRV
jgi:restriction system protein